MDTIITSFFGRGNEGRENTSNLLKIAQLVWQSWCSNPTLIVHWPHSGRVLSAAALATRESQHGL